MRQIVQRNSLTSAPLAYNIIEQRSIMGGGMKAEQTRSRIIESTIALMEESGGDYRSVTIREIAKRAGVGVGLVNHYFGTKEKLIEVGVQKMITDVISSFRPTLDESMDEVKKTQEVAKSVMDFLMANPEISRISILSDMNNPKSADNTMRTVAGFAHRLSGRDGRITAFMLTAVMQGAFLRRELFGDLFGVDFFDKGARDAFLSDAVERLCSAAMPEDGAEQINPDRK